MQNSMRPVVPAAVAVLTVAFSFGPAVAASTSFWTTDSFEALDAGRPDGTSIRDDGSVVLGPPFDRHEIPGAQYVWMAERGPGGEIYAVAGTPGRLFRWSGREPELILEDATADFPALAVSPAGDVFVGTAPGGVVYRVGGDGVPEAFFDTGQGYVWSMAYSPAHGLVVGTGDSARVFVVDEDGRSRTVYRSAEATVSIVTAVGDRVLAGMGSGGLALDVTPGSDVRVLFDSRYDEISGIAEGADGRTFLSAATVFLEQVFGEDDDFGAGFGDGSVYRTTDAGGAVELWYSDDAPVTALGSVSPGGVWAGTGLLGRVYAIGPKGEIDIIAELPDEQILSITGSGGDALVTSGLSGAVYEIRHGVGDSGTFESDVLDARAHATWGEVAWRAETANGSGLRLLTRSGNTTVPDETWSDWEPVHGEGEGEGAIESPSARCLQWKAEMTRGRGAGPVLRAVEAAYVVENLPPRVISVRVLAAGTASADAESDAPESNRSQGSSGSGARSGHSWSRATASNRGMRTAEWESLDPDGDELEFEVWMRADDETDWKLIESGLDKTRYTWDSMSMPDGRYRMRVVAGDGPDNPPEFEGTGEAASAPFIVDNSPPEFEALDVRREGVAVRIRGGVSDDWSPISRVDVSIDYGDWEAVYSNDGSYDSLGESFDHVLDAEDVGESSVAVRAIDRSGNMAVRRQILR
jgi:hypothetical protein